MIAIINKGPYRNQDPGGWREYQVVIGKKEICRFRHKRKDGLAECLRRAAKAVDKAKMEELINLVNKPG